MGTYPVVSLMFLIAGWKGGVCVYMVVVVVVIVVVVVVVEQGLSLLCAKCGHKWTYRGGSRIYVTCPQCIRKVNILDC